MPGNAFGERFVVTTFGESHGGVVGVVVDGCPAGHPFPHARIQAQLDRRRPGRSRLSSSRREPDAIEVGSGIDPESGLTLGTPISMWVRNEDAKPQHYDELQRLYRPSHADYTYDARYGLRFVAGGGRASARETVGRVAAGALAEDLLERLHGISIVAWVDQVHAVQCPPVDPESITRAEVDAHEVRCPDPDAAARMTEVIEAARHDRDTVGGVLRCVARGVPPGLGEPVFDKLGADLAAAMMSLPASRGFELGEGFAATLMRGSEHNDAFVPAPERPPSTPFGEVGIRTRTNRSGGIQGGLSNGETIRFGVAFKPVATIFQPQDTVDRQGKAATLTARGRHDPCVLPRAVPMVEAMCALVLCDHLLRRLGVRVEELLP
ncbi:chorismate synthase [Paraliomyxa miuraensis]|uniref:chorismate synthase n=1 Tax=Paraliomyxa miuraensis TaxID=376150 RepID=UPI002259F7C1|nr:chorismate synthase [Paraliomyxa miuraensis]MCX4242114.1 chorismate synthase [Paraliomyxa miuraensis]